MNIEVMFDLIAFDADDTLWHNETLYARAQEKFQQLLASYHSQEWVEQRLYETEMRNLQHFGYGIKAFTLSMIETAIELTEGRIQGDEILQIVEAGKEMLNAEVQLLDNVEQTLATLSAAYPLMVITKGDLLDQHSKIERSGLARYFQHIEVVSEKSKESYAALLTRHKIDAGRFIMIGNSLKSDILPVLELGGSAVYIPYSLTWAHETIVDQEVDSNHYYQIERLALLPSLIDEISRSEREGSR
jgi:putative hydrolase of the HAD superfamily